MAEKNTFSIFDLRGGVNDSDSPTLLADNQVVDAENVDLRDGALGAKRRGTEGIDLTGSILNSTIAALIRHIPSNSLSNDELWAIDENGNLDRRVGGTWAGGVTRVNTNVTISASNFDANGASLHGKLFLAARGQEDRLLVWDGTVLRWAGISQKPVPTVAATGDAGSYSGTRYFRIRYTEQLSGVTVRRSEPSDVVSFTPDGTKTGAVVTKPVGTEVSSSLHCEGQTHWEVEASLDNILFYRIATVAIATTTSTDTTVYATGYSANTLSEAIGEYVPPGSARHVTVDEDRVVLAGSYFAPASDSTVWWTPVGGDDGVGNDERIPTATSQFITFDGLDGGRATALVAGVAGNVYVFKFSRHYKMVRTGIVTSAYSPITESFSRGATMRSACAGTDMQGLPCVYFVDSAVGLCRNGQRGVEDLARSIRDTWADSNQNPAIASRLLHYPTLDQVWWTIPVIATEDIKTSQGETLVTATSDTILVSPTSPEVLVNYEVRYGSNWFHTGLLKSIRSMVLGTKGEALIPVIGTDSVAIGGGNNSTIHFADTGTTDGGTAYRGYVKTKPYVLGNLWTKFGLMAGMLLARAAASTTIAIDIIRNFGIEERPVTVSLTPSGSESHVTKSLDDAYMSELNTVQLEYGDSAASSQVWSLDQFVFRVRSEDASAG